MQIGIIGSGSVAGGRSGRDLAVGIDIARQNPQIFAGFQAFDFGDLAAANASAKSGNITIKF